MTATVNGRPYSAGNWNELYWSFPQMLAYASRGTRLRPGDIIGSGTVGTGCILELSRVHGHKAYPWLSEGDEVVLDMAQLGSIIARIAPPSRPPIPLT
jgi:2-keto-4-pentenoate hydratase/2-oxohepta-3-ene-1,7-dioic acid hydratase in catechol pathway